MTTDQPSPPPPTADSASHNASSTKRKAESSPSPTQTKRGRKASDANQTTLEEAFDTSKSKEEESNQNTKMELPEGSEPSDDKTIRAGESFEGKTKDGEAKDDPEKSLKDSRGGKGLNAITTEKPSETSRTADDLNQKDLGGGSAKDVPHDDVHAHMHDNPEAHSRGGGEAIDESKERAESMPSNMLEKGIIYFFTRSRVGVEDAQEVNDLQRSYFVLRPLPDGTSLGSGSIPDLHNNRLLALPKKVWPKSGRDKFMVFVERGKTSISDLKENFLQGSDYDTATVGTRHTSAMTPIGEGVYAITTADNRAESHLAYILTIPSEPGQLQEDVGIRSKGSFVISLKNPTAKGPANAQLPQGPGYPQEFIDEFRGRSWMPVAPKHLDYDNAQMLLIGEDIEGGHALEATAKDSKNDDKDTPAEELEKLGGEDEVRVEGLKGDDSIFEDLKLSHKEYPDVATTW